MVDLDAVRADQAWADQADFVVDLVNRELALDRDPALALRRVDRAGLAVARVRNRLMDRRGLKGIFLLVLHPVGPAIRVDVGGRR